MSSGKIAKFLSINHYPTKSILKALKKIFLRPYSSLIFLAFENIFRNSKNKGILNKRALSEIHSLKQIAEGTISFLVL
jgi:hypothetical protein